MTQILYGKNPVIEAVRAGRRKIHEIYVEGRKGKPNDSEIASLLLKHHSKFRIVEKSEIDSLTRQAKHQGIAAKADDFPYSTLEQMVEQFADQALFVMGDSIQDPQNLGAICRSAYCFGAHGIILNKDQSVDITPVVCKASAGAVEYLSVAKVTNLARSLEYLKENGFWTYGAVANATDTLDQLKPSPKMVLVMGSEGEGIRRLVLEKCDFQFSIKMARKFDSLNVAQAASVILYAISRKLSP
ncbi:MAG: 23S rRNA (guanosine(2251)-2'-O)-methyltransferase RlmB [Deltaproteobacteria bacterium]|nr:23S rRNA (guanosine(2251)-2'-O)-methyltransferase RlmB [Deltaproteobacteria bacterium]